MGKGQGRRREKRQAKAESRDDWTGGFGGAALVGGSRGRGRGRSRSSYGRGRGREERHTASPFSSLNQPYQPCRLFLAPMSTISWDMGEGDARHGVVYVGIPIREWRSRCGWRRLGRRRREGHTVPCRGWRRLGLPTQYIAFLAGLAYHLGSPDW